MICLILSIILIPLFYFSIKYFIIVYNNRCEHEWETVEDRSYALSDRLVSRRCKKCNKYKIRIYEAKI